MVNWWAFTRGLAFSLSTVEFMSILRDSASRVSNCWLMTEIGRIGVGLEGGFEGG